MKIKTPGENLYKKVNDEWIWQGKIVEIMRANETDPTVYRIFNGSSNIIIHWSQIEEDTFKTKSYIRSCKINTILNGS